MTLFGVHIGLQHTTADELRSVWRRVEDLGFGGDGPEQVTHTFGEAANGGRSHLATCAPLGAVE